MKRALCLYHQIHLCQSTLFSSSPSLHCRGAALDKGERQQQRLAPLRDVSSGKHQSGAGEHRILGSSVRTAQRDITLFLIAVTAEFRRMCGCVCFLKFRLINMAPFKLSKLFPTIPKMRLENFQGTQKRATFSCTCEERLSTKSTCHRMCGGWLQFYSGLLMLISV